MATATMTHRTVPRRLQARLFTPMPLPGAMTKTLEGPVRVSGSSGDSRDHSRAPGELGAPSAHPRTLKGVVATLGFF